MKLERLVGSCYDVAQKHGVGVGTVYRLVEFQDFKRRYRGLESDFGWSCKVVDRYFGRKKR